MDRQKGVDTRYTKLSIAPEYCETRTQASERSKNDATARLADSLAQSRSHRMSRVCLGMRRGVREVPRCSLSSFRTNGRRRGGGLKTKSTTSYSASGNLGVIRHQYHRHLYKAHS
ncbi:hypothetical protein CH63R_11510 [Colletotrichum higginsianum IMI 349063]|nr:hypothetical protein CH63R_11510 [Colletotrichum higginsianum IMI 349063]OBR04807.1 hypothetical protein CH63R_11510 [Colletotrichum higginsianum IMI 349063]